MRFPTHTAHKSHFCTGQHNVARQQIHAFLAVQNPIRWSFRQLVIQQHSIDAGKGYFQTIGVLPAQCSRQTALGVAVDQQATFAGVGKSDAKVQSGRGLSNAAFLVCQCDYSTVAHSRFSFNVYFVFPEGWWAGYAPAGGGETHIFDLVNFNLLFVPQQIRLYFYN